MCADFRNVEADYLPSATYERLKPAVAGNTINGLGETLPRRPSSVFHRVEFEHPWSAVQNWFYEETDKVPELFEPIKHCMDLEAEPHSPIAATPEHDNAAAWTQRIRKFALGETAAETIGVARMNREWIYQDIDADEITEPYIVVLGGRMEYAKLAQAPSIPAQAEIMKTYARVHDAARLVAEWIRGKGWHAHGYGRPVSGKVNIIPAAIAAGVGELGKHGSLMSRELGANMRLSYVLTELPLVPASSPIDLGVDDFCTNCRLCTNACPPSAIADEKQTVRGVERWYVDFDKCVPYFAERRSCGICLAVCPWARPDVSITRLSEKMLARRERQSESHDEG